MIIGIVIGILCCIFVVLLLIVFFMRRKGGNDNYASEEMANGNYNPHATTGSTADDDHAYGNLPTIRAGGAGVPPHAVSTIGSNSSASYPESAPSEITGAYQVLLFFFFFLFVTIIYSLLI